jgi:hypothetical protein
MGAYLITRVGRTALEAFKPFEKEKFVDYRDALKGPCAYNCKVSSLSQHQAAPLLPGPRVGSQARLVQPVCISAYGLRILRASRQWRHQLDNSRPDVGLQHPRRCQQEGGRGIIARRVRPDIPKAGSDADRALDHQGVRPRSLCSTRIPTHRPIFS